MIYGKPICMECKNYLRVKGMKCKAFPNGIPKDILTGEFDHIQKHPDQKNDILFELINAKRIFKMR